MRIVSLLALCLLVFLGGCAGGHRLSPEVSLAPSQSSRPDSLKAKFDVDVLQNGSSRNLSGVLFAVPGKRYRFEFSGPMGLGGVSLLWFPEGWTLTVSSERKYLKGTGDIVEDSCGSAFPAVDVHQIAAFFWGDLLPRGDTIISARDTLGMIWMTGETAHGEKFLAGKEKSSQRVTWLETSLGEKIRFSDFREFDSLILPSKIEISRDRGTSLKITIKSVSMDASWGEGIWHLKVPESYTSF